MTVPVERKSGNIVRSINKFIEDNFSTPNSIDTNFQDSLFDNRDKDLWLDVKILKHGAGRLSETMVQLDVYSRVRGDEDDGDQMGADLIDAADKLHAAMHVDRIQLYDFTTPASPTPVASRVLMVQNSAGKFREPEDDTDVVYEAGVIRRSLTYRFRLPSDASASPAYYD